MNHVDKIMRCEAIFKECVGLLDKKGRDYSGIEDGMGNFKVHGSFGIVVRLHDKMCRLNQLYKKDQPTVVAESIDDTLVDLINYAALAIVMRQIELEGRDAIS